MFRPYSLSAHVINLGPARGDLSGSGVETYGRRVAFITSKVRSIASRDVIGETDASKSRVSVDRQESSRAQTNNPAIQNRANWLAPDSAYQHPLAGALGTTNTDQYRWFPVTLYCNVGIKWGVDLEPPLP
jgi:hypothetical protein